MCVSVGVCGLVSANVLWMWMSVCELAWVCAFDPLTVLIAGSSDLRGSLRLGWTEENREGIERRGADPGDGIWVWAAERTGNVNCQEGLWDSGLVQGLGCSATEARPWTQRGREERACSVRERSFFFFFPFGSCMGVCARQRAQSTLREMTETETELDPHLLYHNLELSAFQVGYGKRVSLSQELRDHQAIALLYPGKAYWLIENPCVQGRGERPC